jgi:O-succinylbenzoate synthase
MFIQTWRASFPIVPFFNARHGWSARESLLVELACPASGVRGLGEASPLPGFSRETIGDVEHALRHIDLGALSFGTMLSELLSAPALSALPPAARFALEMALLDGVSQLRRTPITQILEEVAGNDGVSPARSATPDDASPQPSLVPAAAVIDVSKAEHIEEALDWHRRGVSVFKVKVGADLPRETSLLRAWNQRFSSERRAFALRLDANQSLSEALFDRCGDWWRDLPIGYVEEPCPRDVLQRLLSRPSLPLPIALDETLCEGAAVVEPWLDRLSALVCKPMYLGGITTALEWARLAQAHGLPFVVSHLLDGPLAMSSYRALAEVVAPHTPAGLGPHPGLTLWNNHLQPREDGLGLGFGRRPDAV